MNKPQITDRERSEEIIQNNPKFMLDVFNAIQDGISILDKNFNIIKVNSWMEESYAEEMPLMGKKCYEVYQKRDDLCPWCPSLIALKTGEKSSSVVPYPSENNPSGWIELTSHPLKDNDGRILGIIEHVKDISKQTKAEKHLKQSLEKVEFFKDLLIHDMGNYLSNMMLSVELMQEMDGFHDKSEQEKNLWKSIYKQIHRSSSLISNVRKLANLEINNESFQEINVKLVLEKAIISIKNVIKQQIEIVTQYPEGKISAIAGSLLYDAFYNILLNAAIHNQRIPIKLKIIISRIKGEKEDLIKIEFKDNGMGIVDNRKESVFERDLHHDKSLGGLGIGLSIVKRIIYNYQGEIWVEDRVKGDHTQGCNFVILLKTAPI